MTRTIFCRLFHLSEDQITTRLKIDDKWIEYPDICYRCQPNVFLQKAADLEQKWKEKHEL